MFLLLVGAAWLLAACLLAMLLSALFRGARIGAAAGAALPAPELDRDCSGEVPRPRASQEQRELTR